MERLNFFKRVFYSFYNTNYYRHVATNDKGLGLGFLCKVLLLNWLICTVIITSLLVYFWNNSDFQKGYHSILKQIPVITIEKGKASIAETTPYPIYLPGIDKPFAVIDTSTTKVRDDIFPGAFIFVTEQKIEVKKSNVETRTYYLSEFGDVVVGPEQLDGMMRAILFFGVPISWIFVILGSFAFRILQFFLYAGLGNVFNGIFNASLSFEQLGRITAAALTPVLILDLGLFFFWSGLPMWVFNFILAMVFLGYGVNANKPQNPVPTSY